MQRPQTLEEMLQSLKSFPKSFQEFIQQEDNTQQVVPETAAQETKSEENPAEIKDTVLSEPDRKKRRLERNKKSACLHRERKNRSRKSEKIMLHAKQMMSIDVILSVLMRFVHPSAHIREKCPNPQSGDRLNGCLVTGKCIKSVCRRDQVVITFNMKSLKTNSMQFKDTA